MKLRKKILVVLGILIGIKVLVGLFFNIIYYPVHPGKFNKYVLRPGYEAGIDPKPGEIVMTPPIGGCFSSCQGREERGSCSEYSKAYNYCDYKCYGYIWNNCDGKTGVIKMLLVKYEL